MVAWVSLERLRPYGDYDPLWKFAMVATLGITLFLSIQVFRELNELDTHRSLGLKLVGCAVLAGYFVSLLGGLKGADYYRFYLINADLHLLVAIAPFVFQKALGNAFWQYNKSLFLRVGICAIYSSTIYIGCVIAIACLNSLFNLHIKEHIYFQLWFIVLGVFSTWFFFGGVPKEIKTLETVDDYPNGLRIFTQFILIPLVVLYYVILYLYMGKIIVTWNLPVGWLSSFIIGASLLGILTLLLVYPLRGRSEFGWIKTYARFFYLALLPLVVLMAVAIFRRISDYGMTVERYFVLLFTIWLFYVALKFTFRPQTDIRLIPTSLFILILAVTFGPLSAVSMSARSQIGRLEYYLTKTGYLADGKLHKGKRKASFKDAAEISSITEYLHRMHGLGSLNRWAKQGDDFKTSDHFSFCRDYLGFEFIHQYQRDFYGEQTGQFSLYYSTKPNNLMNVQGYDYIYFLPNMYRVQPAYETPIQTPRGDVRIALASGKNVLEFRYADETVAFDLDPILAQLKESKGINASDIDPAMLSFEKESSKVLIRLAVSSLNGRYSEDVPLLDNLSGYVLIRFRGDHEYK